MAALRVCPRLLVCTLVSLPLAAPAWGQSSQHETFHRAYYLQNETGDLEAALELYLEVAEDRRAPAELREEALGRAQAIGEDLAASDFTQLVPRDVLLYAELSRPGEQLSLLLDQLGLLGEAGQPGASAFGISPLLVDGLLGMRGAAIAVTEVDLEGGEPNGVLILHPGDLDVVRGLIETAVPAGGTGAEPIGGHPTWTLDGEVYVTLTSRLMIASPDADQIAQVVERMTGGGGPSLAENDALASVLDRRDEALLTFCINAEPILPFFEGMLAEQARHDPEAALALAFLDPGSLRSVSGHLGVDEDGVNVELALELARGHRSLAFDLMRLPSVERETLALVPEGSAFFVALGLNPEGPVAPILRNSEGRPLVSFMDFGRELFGNLTDVVVYGLPSDPQAGLPIPDLAVVMKVNDVERSEALWDFVLGCVGGAAGGSMEPTSVRIAGQDVDRYSVEGIPLYLATGPDSVVISPSRTAVQRALEAGHGRSVLDDATYANHLGPMTEGHTLVAMANVGRCVELAAGLSGPRDAQEMAPIAALCRDTMVSVGLEHTETRLALHARVESIPDVSLLVAEALHGSGRPVGEPSRRRLVAEAAAPRPAEDLRDRFAELALSGQHDAAREVGRAIFDAQMDDANALNDFAWTLATAEPYAGNYLDLALPMSERANELTDYQSWYYVDTLAHCYFSLGEVKEAVRLERLAVELAGNDPRGDEARKALARFEGALDEVALR